MIDTDCRNTIADYSYLQEAPDGSKLKKKVKNPDTGVSYEKHGHLSDANDYFFTYAFAEIFTQYRGGSRGVLTSTSF
jgi:hypothetical protein